MSLSSITIKLDFNSEAASTNSSNLALQSNVPVPTGFSPIVQVQSEGSAPTPFDSFAQMANVQDQVPTPLLGCANMEINEPPVPSPEVSAIGNPSSDTSPPQPDAKIKSKESGKS